MVDAVNCIPIRIYAGARILPLQQLRPHSLDIDNTGRQLQFALRVNFQIIAREGLKTDRV
jgi:hypothetical protein